MDLLVPRQIALVIASKAADRAHVRLLASVLEEVPLQVTRLGGPERAKGARKRPFVCVGALVPGQMPCGGL